MDTDRHEIVAERGWAEPPGRGPRLRDRVEQLVRAMRPTPIVPLDVPGIKLFAKLEHQNPVGSLKDRPALWILKSAIERGDVDHDVPIVESSSGNFAIAVAAYCRLLGLRFTPVIDPNISRLNEAILRSTCESVAKVVEPDDTGGFLKTRLSTVRQMCAQRPESFWLNQYANIDGMLGHYHLTGAEICDALPELDYLFVGVSSAGTISGLSRRLKERYPGVRVIAVDAEGSVIFGGPPKKRRLPGIGASIVPELLQHAQIDEVMVVREIETVRACREMLARHRLFLGGSSGTVYHAIKRFFARPGRGSREPTVLFLCADRGTPYLDTIYDDSWCAKLEAEG